MINFKNRIKLIKRARNYVSSKEPSIEKLTNEEVITKFAWYMCKVPVHDRHIEWLVTNKHFLKGMPGGSQQIKGEKRKKRVTEEYSDVYEKFKLLNSKCKTYEERAAVYKRYRKSTQWKSIREIILNRDGYKCRCGSTNRLQVHHLSYKYKFREYLKLTDLITLCHECHEEIHKNNK